jgi:DNA-binding XRE family transcriptional regulator
VMSAWGERTPNPKFDVFGFRTRMGWTQAEMAKKMAISTMTILRWEREGVGPPDWRIRRMQQLERDKEMGSQPERPCTDTPVVEREFPESSAKTGQPKHIGVVPGSF